ncbi:hypothetical protein [Agathobaculum desmolans]|uniref:hypothetical protein n=1 Tax=Agathobaculum desmolans TaxID=39484 RepID=UPI0004E288C4|nr:hypothetical protein [Agathobaculum desmolans]
MSVFWQSVLAVLAAVGFYSILHEIYEWIAAYMLRRDGTAELTLYGDGCDAAAEQWIRAAVHVRRQFLPGLSIIFVETGSGKGQNIAKHLAARQDIMYLE